MTIQTPHPPPSHPKRFSLGGWFYVILHTHTLTHTHTHTHTRRHAAVHIIKAGSCGDEWGSHDLSGQPRHHQHHCRCHHQLLLLQPIQSLERPESTRVIWIEHTHTHTHTYTHTNMLTNTHKRIHTYYLLLSAQFDSCWSEEVVSTHLSAHKNHSHHKNHPCHRFILTPTSIHTHAHYTVHTRRRPVLRPVWDLWPWRTIFVV